MTWSFDKIPDLSGKLALVTGGNSGIGYWTCLHLAQHGAQVVMACRSMPRAEAALLDLQAAVPSGQFEILPLDLSDLASVRSAAALFRARHPQLDILCHNAGIAMAPMARTKDGFESHFGANFLGHFALTGLLIDTIQATPGARVVHVGSMAHRLGRMDFADPNFEQRPYKPIKAYSQSKLANLQFMLELDRRFKQLGIGAISVGAHPGMSATNITTAQTDPNTPMNRFVRKFINTAEGGSSPSLRAATMPDVTGGSYYGPGGFLGIKGPPALAGLSKQAKNAPEAKQLWELAEQLTGVRFLA